MNIKSLIVAGLAVLLLGSIVGAPRADAINVFDDCTGANKNTAVCKAKSDSANYLIRAVVNTLIFITAAISVVMVIIGGIKYTISNGADEKMKSAKNTILYSIIGLVVAVAAYAIVGFIISRL